MPSAADRRPPALPRPLAWGLLAFGVRCIYLVAHGIVLTDDSASYLRIANNLAVHAAYSLDPSGVVPTIRFAPLYPALLALLQIAGLTPFVAAAWLQAATDGATTALVFVMARRIAPRRWADAAAVVYALHPGVIAASASVLSETLFTLLVVAAAYSVLRGVGNMRFDWRTVAAGGLLLGLAALCRPIALAYVFVFAGVIAATFRPVRLVAAATLVAAACAAIGPWAARSSALAGRFVPVQAASPVLFYLPTRMDWNQRDQAALWPAFANDDAYGRLFATSRTPREMADADAFGRELALANIRERPGAYLRSRLRALPYLVLTSFDSFTGRSRSFGSAIAERDWPTLVTKLGLMTVFCVLPLGFAIAAAVMRPGEPTSRLATAIWVSTLILHVPMWIEPRFWLPAVPFVLITAARAGATRRTSP